MERQHPIRTFVDTSIFVYENFQFSSGSLNALLSRCKAGEIKLVMPEVTVREIREKIREQVGQAQAAVARAQKKGRVLRNLLGHPLAALFESPDWNAIEQQLQDQFNQFQTDSSAKILSSEADDVMTVLEDHYSINAPFGEHGKRNEFVDAFAIRAILRHAQFSQGAIHVVSRDDDLRRACERFPGQLVYSDSLPAILELALKARPLTAAKIKELLEPHRAALEKGVVKSFENGGFYWDTDMPESEVEEVYEVDLEEWEWAVTEVEGDRATITGDATFNFQAAVSYSNPDTAMWDSEDKEVVYFDTRCPTLSATVTIPVSFRVRLGPLTETRLEFDELNVNNDEDVWFSGWEMEEF